MDNYSVWPTAIICEMLMMKEQNLTITEIAKRIKKSRGSVSGKLQRIHQQKLRDKENIKAYNGPKLFKPLTYDLNSRYWASQCKDFSCST